MAFSKECCVVDVRATGILSLLFSFHKDEESHVGVLENEALTRHVVKVQLTKTHTRAHTHTHTHTHTHAHTHAHTHTRARALMYAHRQAPANKTRTHARNCQRAPFCKPSRFCACSPGSWHSLLACQQAAPLSSFYFWFELSSNSTKPRRSQLLPS